MTEELLESGPSEMRERRMAIMPWLVMLAAIVVLWILIVAVAARVKQPIHAQPADMVAFPSIPKASRDAVPMAISRQDRLAFAVPESPGECSSASFFCVNADSSEPAQTLRHLVLALPKSTVKRYQIHVVIEAIPDPD